MIGMAHTLPYDLTILAGTQSGRPLPADRWSGVTAPTLVLVGTSSEAFFHMAAKALAGIIPTARYAMLEGCDHSAVLMDSAKVAKIV